MSNAVSNVNGDSSSHVTASPIFLPQRLRLKQHCYISLKHAQTNSDMKCPKLEWDDSFACNPAMIEVDSLSASNVHCKLQSSPHCSILFHILCCLSIQYKSSPLDSFASVLLFASHSTLHHNASLQYLFKWECHLLSGKHLMSAALWKRKITSTKLDFHTKAWSNSSETQASSLRNLNGKVTSKLVELEASYPSISSLFPQFQPTATLLFKNLYSYVTQLAFFGVSNIDI